MTNIFLTLKAVRLLEKPNQLFELFSTKIIYVESIQTWSNILGNWHHLLAAQIVVSSSQELNLQKKDTEVSFELPPHQYLVLRNSYNGAYRQGIIRGVPPSPNVSAQTPYVLGGWATPVWLGRCPCRLLPYVYPSSEHCPLYGYRLKTRGDLYTSTPYNANWALYFLCSRSPSLKITLTDRAHYVASNAHSRSTSFANARAITSTSKTHNFISSRELDPSSWRVFREAGNSNALGTVVWIRYRSAFYLSAQLHHHAVSPPPLRI